MILNSKVYDVLKWIVAIVLPAILTFVGVVMNTLNYEYSNVVLTIGAAFITMLGTILGISNYNYNKGGK